MSMTVKSTETNVLTISTAEKALNLNDTNNNNTKFFYCSNAGTSTETISTQKSFTTIVDINRNVPQVKNNYATYSSFKTNFDTSIASVNNICKRQQSCVNDSKLIINRNKIVNDSLQQRVENETASTSFHLNAVVDFVAPQYNGNDCNYLDNNFDDRNNNNCIQIWHNYNNNNYVQKCCSQISDCRHILPIQQQPQKQRYTSLQSFQRFSKPSLLTIAKCLYIVVIILEALNFQYSHWLPIFVEGKANEVDIDWTLESNLFHKGDRITTKFVRMKDILHIRCAPIISFNIYMVPAESAMFCKLPDASSSSLSSSASSSSTSTFTGSTQKLKQTIGSCSPKTGDPQVNIRASNLLPDRPVFQEGHSYFLITTSSGTTDGIENTEGGLCQTHGMRLRLIVLSASAEIPTEQLTSFHEIFPNLQPPQPPPSPLENIHTWSVEEAPRRPPHRSPKTAPPDSNESMHRINEARRRHQYYKPESNSGISLSNRNSLKNYKTDADHISDGFPAILTLEDHGRLKKILVHNSKQLQDEINRASEANVNVQQIQEYMSSKHVPQYSLTGHGQINAIPYNRHTENSLESTPKELWHNSGNAAGYNHPSSSGSSASYSVSSSYRRNVGSESRQVLDNVVENLSPRVYLSSSSSSSSFNTNSERDEMAMSSKNGRHLPFTYIVGYNSGDDSYGDVASSSITILCHRISLFCTALIPFLFVATINAL